MYDKNFAKLVHKLAKNPKARQEFLNGGGGPEVPCDSPEHKALQKIFSQPGHISTGIILGVIPLGYWG